MFRFEKPQPHWTCERPPSYGKPSAEPSSHLIDRITFSISSLDIYAKKNNLRILLIKKVLIPQGDDLLPLNIFSLSGNMLLLAQFSFISQNMFWIKLHGCTFLKIVRQLWPTWRHWWLVANWKRVWWGEGVRIYNICGKSVLLIKLWRWWSSFDVATTYLKDCTL